MFHKGSREKPRGLGFGGFTVNSKPKEQTLQPSPVASQRAVKHKISGKSQSMAFKRPANFGDESESEDENSYYGDKSKVYEPEPICSTNDNDDEEDELDKFMAGIEQEVEREKILSATQQDEKASKKSRRDDIEDEDDQESFFRIMKEAPLEYYPDEDEEIDYDSDGNPIAPPRSKIIEPLPPIDHSEIAYKKFSKNFYEEHDEIKNLTPEAVIELRKSLGLKVSGAEPPRPAASFAHFCFDEALLTAIRKSEYTKPTAIQSQAVPAAVSGRDILGIAKTGSGKTAAFLWPMLVHIMDQREMQVGDGPIGLICAPTRELSQQIYLEAKKFGKVYNIRVACVFGGGNKYEQSKSLKEYPEIVVATPGRLIDHIKDKTTNLERVTFLVFDEADRMFDMGFEPQVRSIANHVRPDRQTLLFSATFKKKVELLCRDILTDPVRIVVGELGEANEDVTQIVQIFNDGAKKWQWLVGNLVRFTSEGSVLIFVTKKLNSEELSQNLKRNDFELLLIHGDMDQFERNKVITSFKKKEFTILVATDVAARGLDIPSIKTVINYDVARDITTHTHRIGRTGRAGVKGTAYTLMTPSEQNFAGDLVRNLEIANQYVSEELLELAMKNTWFRKSRYRGGQGKRGTGGVRERPGLGAPDGATAGPMASARNLSSYSSTVSASAGSGPSSSRLNALKAAFSSQYRSHFTPSTENNKWDASKQHSTVNPLEDNASLNKEEKRKSKKSRWN
ncbi:ATP-dependent RNA helicase DDX42-like isoform X2 [Xenia sp. Carnegie-2017]|uniref:ATP-dependent RNA helicase DDX42-like isoform X2 n=1 Tax=Xenia sp. Carnegie-2017 TaxID=2897299 RepID=UPI001F041E5E|nr:ATP-dependent RNA helicase DDX42-like isoform X2 [Xenia sp. Carnegie-2017]